MKAIATTATPADNQHSHGVLPTWLLIDFN